VWHTIDPHKHLIQVPAPLRIVPVLNAPFPDLRRKQRTEPIPPEPYCLMADIDATFMQDIFDLTQRQGVADVQASPPGG
jgi:hypothetical protein